MFEVSVRNSSWYGKLNVPQQMVKDLTMSSTVINKKEISIVYDLLDLEFSGKRTDSNTIRGTFRQNGKQYPLVLKRVWGEWPKSKPQTPKAPFSYIQEKVKISAADGRISIAGTLTKPDSSNRFPAIILISGSGAQDRDGSIGNHKPFKVLADFFTKSGFSVLRCDDRGAGETKGHPETIFNTTTLSLAEDVDCMISYLKSRPDIDTSRIILIGHSEGGIVAPIVASERNNIFRIVLLAGPGISGLETNTFQNRVALKAAGIKDRHIQSFLSVHRQIINRIIQRDSSNWKQDVQQIVAQWMKKESTGKARKILFHGNSKNWDAVFDTYSAFHVPWWNTFLSLNPVQYLKEVNCPVLVLQGSRDNQVPEKLNIPEIKKALNGKTHEIAVFQGLNHLFQYCDQCTVDEYFSLEETFNIKVMEKMLEWINKTSP